MAAIDSSSADYGDCVRLTGGVGVVEVVCCEAGMGPGGWHGGREATIAFNACLVDGDCDVDAGVGFRMLGKVGCVVGGGRGTDAVGAVAAGAGM